MKKKWFYIFAIVLSSALIVAGVVFLFMVNYGVKRPEAVEIFTRNNKTYIETTLNDNEFGYIFKFESDDDSQTYSSLSKLICADNLINDGTLVLGETYKVSVCYKNEYENGYSNFSQQKQWLASKFLEKPEIFTNCMPDYVEDYKFWTVSWNPVENATKYEVFYTNGSELVCYPTTQTYINLCELIGGQHNFYVIAKSSEEKYLDSPKSDTISATCYHDVKPFASAKFNKTTKMLTITAFEDINDIEVWVGTNENDLVKKEFSYIAGGTNFKKNQALVGCEFVINIGYIYTDSITYIAVKPSASGYNIYSADYTVVSFSN